MANRFPLIVNTASGNSVQELPSGDFLDLSNSGIANSGNITLNVSSYFIGNGSQLTDVVSSYGNANVTTLLSNLGSNAISTTGNIAAANFNSTSADLAEKYTSDQVYEPGTVLVFGGTSQVTACVNSEDHRAAGVVSTLPAYLMNTELPNVTVAMALAGQVPCYVVGPVSKGDVLTTSTVAGHAKTLDFSLFRPGCVIGKALEDCGPGLHKILIFVSHG